MTSLDNQVYRLDVPVYLSIIPGITSRMLNCTHKMPSKDTKSLFDRSLYPDEPKNEEIITQFWIDTMISSQ